MKYLVLCEHHDGLIVPERMWASMDRATVVTDLLKGQVTNPVIVIAIDLENGTCSDVTEQFRRNYFPAPVAG